MRRVREVVVLLAWAVFLAAALAALHAAGHETLAAPPLDWDGLQAWAAARQPAEVTAALLRLGALGLGWYLLGVTVLGSLVRLVRLAPLIAAADALTTPGVRSMLAAALGASLSVAPAQPAAAAARIPVMHRVSAPSVPPTAITTTTTTTTTTTSATVPTAPSEPSTDDAVDRPAEAQGSAPDLELDPPAGPDEAPAPPPQPSPAPPVPASPVPASPPSPATWTVAPGDNLWRIAASVLEQSSGRAPSPAAVVPYWRSLIESNRSRLRDPADPGLIFAGQVLALPDPLAT